MNVFIFSLLFVVQEGFKNGKSFTIHSPIVLAEEGLNKESDSVNVISDSNSVKGDLFVTFYDFGDGECTFIKYQNT